LRNLWHSLIHVEGVLTKLRAAEVTLTQIEAQRKDANADLVLTLAATKRKKKEHDAFLTQAAQERAQIQADLDGARLQAEGMKADLLREIKTLTKQRDMLQDSINSLKAKAAQV